MGAPKVRKTKTLPVSLSYTFLPLSLSLPDASLSYPSLSGLSLTSPSQVFPVLLHYIHNPSHLHTHAQCRVRMPRKIWISRRSTVSYPLSLSPVSLSLSLCYVSLPCLSLLFVSLSPMSLSPVSLSLPLYPCTSLSISPLIPLSFCMSLFHHSSLSVSHFYTAYTTMVSGIAI